MPCRRSVESCFLHCSYAGRKNGQESSSKQAISLELTLTERKHLGYDYGFPTVSKRKATKEATGSETISQALDLLEVFLSHGSALDSVELAAITKIDRETIQGLLAILEARAYLQRLGEARNYSLGVRLFELGSHFRNQLDIRRAALPELTSMVEETGQAGFLCVRDGDHALCLERIEGRHFFHIFVLGIGERQPLHCGGAPRALLAGMSDSEIEAYAIRTKLPRYTSQTITTPRGIAGGC